MASSKPRGATSELYCMDRAFGHDWDTPHWVEGPTIRRGRRSIFVTHRFSRCVRCGSTRIEVFEQSNRFLEKVANRYKYSRAYRARQRLTPGQIRMALHSEESAA